MRTQCVDYGLGHQWVVPFRSGRNPYIYCKTTWEMGTLGGAHAMVKSWSAIDRDSIVCIQDESR